jgi:hypothetical protein
MGTSRGITLEELATDSAADRRWRRRAEVAAIVVVPLTLVGIVIAVLAWRQPVTFPGQGGDAVGAAPSTSTAAPGSATAPRSQAVQPATTQLTTLQPKSGASNIEVRDGAIVMECARGTTSDPHREVEYSLFGAYQGFRAEIETSGAIRPELRTQFEVFAGDDVQGIQAVQVANVVITGDGSGEIDTTFDPERAEIMLLRLTCQHRDTVLTIRDAGITPNSDA